MSIKKMRDMLAGNITEYVPKKAIHMQDPNYWQFYLKMASPYNITNKTLNTLLGMIFGGGVIYDYTKPVTDSGLSIRDLSEVLAKEILSVGYVGVLLDIENKIVIYNAENILSAKRDNKGNFARVVLQETYDLAPDNDYDLPASRQRFLRLKNGKYYIQVSNEPEVEVRLKGKSLDFIPFIILSYKNINETPRPPLLDLANLNIDHYILDLMFKNGLNVVSMPTPIISANNNIFNDEPLKLGYANVLTLPAGSTAQFLELNGNSLVILQNSIKDLEQKMLIMGTRILEQNKNVGESAEAIRLNQIGEIGVLNGTIDSLQDGINSVLKWFSIFYEDTGSVSINKNFLQQSITAQMIDTFVKLLEKEVVTKEELRNELVKSNLLTGKK